MKKIKIFSCLFLLAVSTLVFMLAPPRAYAETIECADGSVHQVTESDTAHDNVANLCTANGGIKPGATIQPGTATPAETQASPVDEPQYVNNDCDKADLNQNNCGIIKYLVLFIKFLSAVVGVAIVVSIIIGGIQYSVSADDAGAVTAAKKRIMNALLALALYIFSFAILQYLIPGGIL